MVRYDVFLWPKKQTSISFEIIKWMPQIVEHLLLSNKDPTQPNLNHSTEMRLSKFELVF